MFGTSRRSSEPPEASTVAAAGAAASTPSWDAFIPSAARASVATSSSDAPVRARAAAATAPSTSGASHSSTSVSVTISAAISALITALPRSMSTITPSGDFARSIASITTHHVGPDLARRVGHPAGGLDRHVLPAHLPRQLHHTVRQAGAVGDDDEADHYRPAARCRISIGCTDLTPVASSMCQRHVSESHTASSGVASAIWSNSGRPTSIAIPYFSCLSP